MDQIDVQSAMLKPSLRQELDWLRRFRRRIAESLQPDFWNRLSELKDKAVNANDQVAAKAIWCMETIGRIQDHFVSAFVHMRLSEFKEAWDQLERCETEMSFLNKHFEDRSDEFGMEFVRKHTKQFQELYPYSWGVSPAYIKEEVRCSICESNIVLRGGCSHKVGDIYDGEMASRRIVKAKLLHISLVDNPVQKYSVIFPNGNDYARLKPINELASRLGSPWRSWEFQKEERRGHNPAFRHVGRNDACPCGSSLKYKRCCLQKEWVFPHYSILIHSE